MKFDFRDLAKVVGNKFGLEVTEEFLSGISSTEWHDQNVLAFLNELMSISEKIRQASNENHIQVEAFENLYELIPAEYLEQLPLIDDDGKKLMSLAELHKAINTPEANYIGINTNETSDIERERLKASYAHDEYPVYAGLEHSWRTLDKDYYGVVARESHPSDNPLSSFAYYVTSGFYPPPEIMMVIGKGLERYFESHGDISLDEVFFGEKHQKTRSLAYRKHKKMKYSFFEFHIKHKRSNGEHPKLSFEQEMADALASTDPITMVLLGFDPNIDIDSFLRGYRRWKNDMANGRYE